MITKEVGARADVSGLSERAGAYVRGHGRVRADDYLAVFARLLFFKNLASAWKAGSEVGSFAALAAVG